MSKKCKLNVVYIWQQRDAAYMFYSDAKKVLLLLLTFTTVQRWVRTITIIFIRQLEGK